jgi:hypothetical protein
MRTMDIVLLAAVLLTSSASGAHAAPSWSTEAHATLIRQAFPHERADCLMEIQRGSEWVDSLPNQVPAKSYLHAMRSGTSQSVEAARDQMANFIQGEYERAVTLWKQSTREIQGTPADPGAQITADGRLIEDFGGYLSSCYHRGTALHPVMDSTSPAHAGFAIWSMTDLAAIFQHGDLPGTLEDEAALLRHPDLMQKTVGFMRLVDRMYLSLGMLDFRFE